MQDIKRVVRSGYKKRFDLKQVNNEWVIRAISGHTIQVRGRRIFCLSSKAKNIFSAPNNRAVFAFVFWKTFFAQEIGFRYSKAFKKNFAAIMKTYQRVAMQQTYK